MAKTKKKTIIEQAQRIGCWAISLYAMALFFAFGILISLLNADILTALQAIVLTMLCTVGGIWLARRNAGV